MPTLKTAAVTVGLMLVALFVIARFAPAHIKNELGLPSAAV